MNWIPASPATAIAAIRDATRPPRSALPPILSTLTPAQSSAVHRVRSALALHHGALVADPPGSGKSFIALQIALDTHHDGRHVLLTAPAALATTWRRLLRPADIHFSFLSHTRLSLDDHVVAHTPSPDLIIADEAHAFRNPATRRYHTLARLARTAPILLLSATPINNSLMDLYFLLRLFLGDHAFAHAGIPSLLASFTTAASGSDDLPPALRRILAEVVIRRSRKELEEENGLRLARGHPALPAGSSTPSFPRLAPPGLIRYELDDASPGFARFAVKCIADLHLAAFTSGQGDRAPAELLRLTLAKRLESSISAFASSIRSLVSFHLAFLDALDSGHRLSPRDLRPASDDALQLPFAPILAIPIRDAASRARLDRLARLDLATLTLLLDHARPLTRTDPKRAALIRLIHGPLRGRRTLVFTEFRQTAAHLFRSLRHSPGSARLDGSGAAIASGPCSRHHAITHFAPTANGAPTPPPESAITTLIATDILSEGINLQDADCVISYDLPWNPVRLLQRIGRIDRLGSPHATVDAFIFMPDLWLDDFTSLVDRVSHKLREIRRGLAGSPRSTGPATDHHSAFLRALAAGIAPADASHPFTPATPDSSPLSALLRDPRLPATPGPPDTPLRAGIPVATLDSSPDLARATLIVTSHGPGADPRFTLVRNGATRPLSPSRAARLLLGSLDTPHSPPTPRIDARLRRSLHHAATSALAAARVDTGAASARSTSAAGRIIRHILSMTAPFASQCPDLSPLADALVAALARGLTSGAEHAALHWLRTTPPPADPTATLQALTRLQAAVSSPPPSPPRLVAALLLR